MKRSFHAAVPLAVVLVAGGSLGEVDTIHERLEAPGQRYEEDDDEGEEAPALQASSSPLGVEEIVWRHIETKIWWHHGVLGFGELPGRELVPVWMEPPRRVEADLFEVCVEMTAVTLAPSDFPSIGEASYPPRLVPRSPEQIVRHRAKVRGPASWRVTFEVLEVAEGVFEVVGSRVTGRPGERRAPMVLAD